jgi:hypothetical protein
MKTHEMLSASKSTNECIVANDGENDLLYRCGVKVVILMYISHSVWR